MENFKTFRESFQQKRDLAKKIMSNIQIGKRVVLKSKTIMNDEEYFKITKMWDVKNPRNGRIEKKIKMDWNKNERSGKGTELYLKDLSSWLTS